MKYKEFFTGWVWSLIFGFVTILGFFGVTSGVMNSLFSELTTKEIVEYVLLFLACFFFILAVVLKKKDKVISGELYVLQNIAESKKDKDCAKWDYAEYGYSAVPITETWNQWLDGLVSDMERPEIKSYNFGDNFYFFNLDTGKEIKIPTDEAKRNEKVGDLFRKGMVLRLMPRNS